jgi:hypothetical protein
LLELEPPIPPSASTEELLTKNDLPGLVDSTGTPRKVRPFAKPLGKLEIDIVFSYKRL